MYLIPAIDLLRGQVVRLTKGDMNKYKIYSSDPVAMAGRFIDMGVQRLHLVDLDGAKSGDTVNYDVIARIASLGGIKIEAGGGIRNMEQLDRYFSCGVSFAILGTVVAKDREFTVKALEKYPGRIILGIDARNGKVATDGWYEDSGRDALDLLMQYNDYEAESVIYTDINKDGTLTGLNILETARFASSSIFPIIASGGVSSSEDIRMLYELRNPRIAGCIIGKAYYENRIDLAAEIVRMRAYEKEYGII